MMAVNINCRRCDFVGMILTGAKTMETRHTDSLRPYVGKRVGIVRTGCGVATLEGFATIGDPVKVTTAHDWQALYSAHRVPVASEFSFTGVKYAYPLLDVETTTPRPIFTRGIIARKIPEALCRI